ncbi:MAG: hypothetical protein AAF438_19255, partial [Pseudomonadota bacterium]
VLLSGQVFITLTRPRVPQQASILPRDLSTANLCKDRNDLDLVIDGPGVKVKAFSRGILT